VRFVDIKLDPGFKDFYKWCNANDIPVIIVSRYDLLKTGFSALSNNGSLNSGMTPIIRAVLSNLIGEEDAKDIDIISNDVTTHPDGKWDIKYRHPTR